MTASQGIYRRRGMPPVCHPERAHKGKGLCNACYQRSKGKTTTREQNLWNRFRLTSERYDQMLAEQKGCCASCGDPFVETPRVDHDHGCCPGWKSCGKCVRGLLCGGCNSADGYLRSDPDRVLALATYLLRYQRQV